MRRDCGISAMVASQLLLKIFNCQYSRRPIKTDGSYQQLVPTYGYTDYTLTQTFRLLRKEGKNSGYSVIWRLTHKSWNTWVGLGKSQNT